MALPATSPGASLTADGQIQLVGNNGADNAISISLSGLQMTTNGIPPQTAGVTLPFNTVQTAPVKGRQPT